MLNLARESGPPSALQQIPRLTVVMCSPITVNISLSSLGDSIQFKTTIPSNVSNLTLSVLL